MPRLARTLVTLVVLALVMVGCGSSGESTADPTACTEGQVDGDLQLYNWSEYIDPALLTGFEEEFGVTLTETTYDSNEAMLASLQAGVVYDVIVPSDYMVGIMIQQGLLSEINTTAVPNMANLAERFTELPYDPGPVYSAAYQYGTTGLGVNTALVGADFPQSWSLIFDPAADICFPGWGFGAQRSPGDDGSRPRVSGLFAERHRPGASPGGRRRHHRSEGWDRSVRF